MKKDYKDKCGSCVNFERLEIDGKAKERGRCCVRGVYVYHQASQKCCLQYKAEQEERNGN